MRFKTTLLASVAGAAVLATVPAEASGTYISLFGGWNRANDLKGHAGSGTVSISTSGSHGASSNTHSHVTTFTFASNFFNSGAKARDGFVLGAAVGGDLAHMLKGLRGEVELTYRKNRFGAARQTVTNPGTTFKSATFTDTATTLTLSATFAGSSKASSRGELMTWTLMANAWYDIDVGSDLTPYIGGGIGYAASELTHGQVAHGSDGDFAWQLGAGINYKIGDKTSIGIGYRYLDAGAIDVTLATRAGGAPPVDEYDVQSHSVMANINFQFGK